MKKISKKVYFACEYMSEHRNESLTKIANLFQVDRHTISKHLSDYKNYNIFYEDEYYLMSEEEKAPALFYYNNPNINLTEVSKKYGVKGDTIKRRLKVLGLDYSQHMIRQYNRDAFKNLQTLEQAYWLGFILADGYINEERNFLRIKLGSKDVKHLHKFAEFMNSVDEDVIKSDIGGAYTKDNLCYYIEFSSKQLISDLKQYGLFQGKSGNEKPIKMPTEEMTLAYIRGMIDGDGHVENGYFKYVGSLESCEYLKDIFKEWFDFNSNCKYIYQHGTIYSFEIRNKNINPILKKIYSNATVFLDRKYEIVQNL